MRHCSTAIDWICFAVPCIALLCFALLRQPCLPLHRFAVHIVASCFALLCFDWHCFHLVFIALPCLCSYHFALSTTVCFGVHCFACSALRYSAVTCRALLSSEDSPGWFLENRPGYLANPVSLRSLVSWARNQFRSSFTLIWTGNWI